MHLSSISLENFKDRALIIPEILEIIKLHTYKFGLVYFDEMFIKIFSDEIIKIFSHTDLRVAALTDQLEHSLYSVTVIWERSHRRAVKMHI